MLTMYVLLQKKYFNCSCFMLIILMSDIWHQKMTMLFGIHDWIKIKSEKKLAQKSIRASEKVLEKYAVWCNHQLRNTLLLWIKVKQRKHLETTWKTRVQIRTKKYTFYT